ncbi:MAG: DUF3330 domain-containing protein [Gammaproteobacteria bacterium]
MKTTHRTSAGGDIADCAQATGCAPVACEVCLADLPADAVNITDAQDYVHHFCGLGCLERWQKQSAVHASPTAGKPGNRIK